MTPDFSPHRPIQVLVCVALFLSVSFYFKGTTLGQESESADSETATEELTIQVPEKYKSIWPMVAWFYVDLVNDDDQDSTKEIASVLPDSIKHPFISPLLLMVCIPGIFIGSIWFLVAEFKVSLGWGFGQLAANLVSCILIIPGMIVAIVFACLHWKEARIPFTILILSYIIIPLLMMFMIPSWTVPAQ